MRLYTRWLNLSQNRLLDVTNLRLFLFCSFWTKRKKFENSYLQNSQYHDKIKKYVSNIFDLGS